MTQWTNNSEDQWIGNEWVVDGWIAYTIESINSFILTADDTYFLTTNDDTYLFITDNDTYFLEA